MIQKTISALVLLFICVIGIGISIANTFEITFNYYFGEIIIFLPILLVFSFILGVLSCFLALLPRLIQHKIYQRKQQAMNKHQDSEALALIQMDKLD